MGRETPSQTAGPYVHIGLTPNAAGVAGIYGDDIGSVMVGDGDVILTGVIHDGAGAPVVDVMVEAWQADIDAFGRAAADAESGVFQFRTKRSDDAFLTLWVIARGINIGLHTRVYWPGELPDLPGVSAVRLQTLMASQTAPGRYHFDIYLQGPDETVFFDI